MRQIKPFSLDVCTLLAVFIVEQWHNALRTQTSVGFSSVFVTIVFFGLVCCLAFLVFCRVFSLF